MSRSPFGWDLPPGVTSRMIDEAFGGGDPSPESEAVADLIGDFFPERGNMTEQAQLAYDRILEIVDGLAVEREAAKSLLRSALARLPADPPRPPCTCKPDYVGRINFGYCELHDGGGDEPTLREEIETFLHMGD